MAVFPAPYTSTSPQVRAYDLPEFVRKRAEEKGAIQPVFIHQDRGVRATGWNWRGSSWSDGADYWTYGDIA